MADDITNLAHFAQQYALSHLDASGRRARNVYDLLLAQIEPPVISAVLARCTQNQTVAARVLGLSRGTLRKKMKQYGFLPA